MASPQKEGAQKFPDKPSSQKKSPSPSPPSKDSFGKDPLGKDAQMAQSEDIARQLSGVVYNFTAQNPQMQNSQVSHLEEENLILKETLNQLREEVERFRSPALMVAELCEMVGEYAIIRIPNGNKFYVSVASNLKGLEAGDQVLVEQRNFTVIDKVNTSKNFDVEKFVIIEKPLTAWKDVGGLAPQIEQIKEVIELPLLKPELFKRVGINPPKGILLFGPPGTGKTLLAKAVAHSSHATFIEIVASELVQKFIGEGAKLVKEIFDLARAKAPSIVFIDEIDALAARRIDMGTSGEREVQRTFMQFLAEIDGFKPLDNVKVIGCTNRKELLDPAILRPGRLDRMIEIGNPNQEGIIEILRIHTRNMTLDTVSLEEVSRQMDEFSGAEIKAVCTEAGYAAIRENRIKVSMPDFLHGISKVKSSEGSDDFKRMFG